MRIPDDARDRGTSMMEVIVGMGLMAVFMAIFTSTMFSVYRASNHTESVVVSSGQLNTAFIKLDKLVRYASAISTPSSTANGAGNYYVEVQTTNSGSTVCSQLRLNTTTKVLYQRDWRVPSAGTATGLTSFRALSSGIEANGQPFVLTATSSIDFEQLTFNLQSTWGSPAANSDTNITYTALNSNDSSQRARTDPTVPDSVCQEVGRP
ncbi:MAG: hypothetical protein JO144_01395 [Actinobacteria bacterium]|nr:hypothetical protein [Actinomycetota bacterium]